MLDREYLKIWSRDGMHPNCVTCCKKYKFLNSNSTYRKMSEKGHWKLYFNNFCSISLLKCAQVELCSFVDCFFEIIWSNWSLTVGSDMEGTGVVFDFEIRTHYWWRKCFTRGSFYIYHHQSCPEFSCILHSESTISSYQAPVHHENANLFSQFFSSDFSLSEIKK